MIQKISDAGYAARKDDIRLTLTGKLSKQGDRMLLTVEDIKPKPVVFLIMPYKGKDEKTAKANAAAMEAVNALMGENVEVEGLWQPPADKKDRAAPATSILLRVEKHIP